MKLWYSDPYVKVALMQKGRRIRRESYGQKSFKCFFFSYYLSLPLSVNAFEVSVQKKENFNKKVHLKSVLQRIFDVWCSSGMDTGGGFIALIEN